MAYFPSMFYGVFGHLSSMEATPKPAYPRPSPCHWRTAWVKFRTRGSIRPTDGSQLSARLFASLRPSLARCGQGRIPVLSPTTLQRRHAARTFADQVCFDSGKRQAVAPKVPLNG